MSSQEKKCFQILKTWERVDIKRNFIRSWHFPIFLAHHIKPSSKMNTLLIACAINFFLLPLSILFWFFRGLISLVLLPYRFINTYAIPLGLQRPGERNIQGVHNAFIRYHTISQDLYLECIDHWIAKLYGEEIARQCSIKHFLNEPFFNYLENRDHPHLFDPIVQAKITQAREKVTKILGYYT